MATKVKYRYAGSKEWQSDVVLGGRPDEIVKAYLSSRPEIAEIKLSEIKGGTPDDEDTATELHDRKPYPWTSKMARIYRRFDRWFNSHCGWFFTNGNKTARHATDY